MKGSLAYQININMENFNKEIMKNTLEQAPSDAKKPDEKGSISIQGHIKIWDPESKEVIVDKRNAIHYENFSYALAQSVSNNGGFIAEMSFGNGGSRVDPTGIITYLTPNSSGLAADLYNRTYSKSVDKNSIYNKNPSRNFMEVRHVNGTYYTDVMVTCLLDYGEPSNQLAFDNATTTSEYVFDELGLRGFSENGPNTGPLLTHVIFHPVQKSLNRLIQIDYTVRIQSLTNGM
jgi:hypothetical protein